MKDIPHGLTEPLPISTSRVVGLDILRLVAIILVLGAHLKPVTKGVPEALNVFLTIWKRGGWVGVDLFFVLSGFLISGLLFKEHQRSGKVKIGRFLIRRGFKIYPAFWVMISVGIAMWLHFSITHNTPLKIQPLLGELLFLQNYLGGLFNHTWSLAVEEHFYLGFALLVWFLLRWKAENPFADIPYIFVLLAVVCLAIRLVNFLCDPVHSKDTNLFFSHARVDSLFFGVLISYLFYYRNFEKRLRNIPTVIFIIVGLVLLAPAFIYDRFTHLWITVYGLNLFYLGSGVLILAGMRFVECKSELVILLAILGGASYSIYLWFIIWNEVSFKLFGNIGYLVYLPIYVIGSIVFGYVMSRLVEYPVLMIRNKWFPSGSRPAPAKQ